MIVALGANDGLEGVPLSVVRSNLETIVERAQERKIKVLLCGMEALPFHGLDYFVGFRRIFPAVADNYDVPLVPFFLAGIIGNRDLLLPDLVHPNAAGAVQIAQSVWPYVLPLAKDVLNDALFVVAQGTSNVSVPQKLSHSIASSLTRSMAMVWSRHLPRDTGTSSFPWPSVMPIT